MKKIFVMPITADDWRKQDIHAGTSKWICLHIGKEHLLKLPTCIHERQPNFKASSVLMDLINAERWL